MSACGVECATAQEEFDKSLDELQKKQMEHMFKKAEGCEELVSDAPQTKEELYSKALFLCNYRSEGQQNRARREGRADQETGLNPADIAQTGTDLALLLHCLANPSLLS